MIVRDLPMALGGLTVGKMRKIPVAIDMAEVYPLGLRDNWKYDQMKWSDIFVRNPFFADIVEKITLKFADYIFVVSPEAREYFLRRNFSDEKITEVGNTPDLTRFDPRAATGAKNTVHPGAFQIIFVGDRGLNLSLSAMEDVIRRQPAIHLTIVGDGPMRGEIERQRQQLGLENNVRLTGWIENRLVPSFIAQADLGLLPFLPCEHIHTTLPNKLFDYMAMGVPVLAADTQSLKRVVSETGCGITFRAGSEQDLADKILTMYEDSELRKKCSRNGRAFTLRKYNWGEDSGRLLGAIATLRKHRGITRTVPE
jgi:glycosyltransferase involved in cell wall biosynthesis